MQRMIDRVWAGRGRVRRSKFWLFVAILMFFPAALLSVLKDTLSWDILPRPGFSDASETQLRQIVWEADRLQFVLILSILLITNLLFFLLCVGRRRDRGQAGLDIVLFAIPSIGFQLFPSEGERFAQLIEALLVIWGLVLLVQLGFFKGTEGPNRFGPDPVEPEAPSHSPSIFE